MAQIGLILIVAVLGSASLAADLPLQDSTSDGVTIAVKPINVDASSATWSFDVSLRGDGHDLNDDLLRTAYLINRAAGKNVAPMGWRGDAAGARQRRGVLSFNAFKPMPAAIELRIQRAGEKAPRVFRWDLDCPCNDPKMHPERAGSAGGAPAPSAGRTGVTPTRRNGAG